MVGAGLFRFRRIFKLAEGDIIQYAAEANELTLPKAGEVTLVFPKNFDLSDYKEGDYFYAEFVFVNSIRRVQKEKIKTVYLFVSLFLPLKEEKLDELWTKVRSVYFARRGGFYISYKSMTNEQRNKKKTDGGEEK